MSTSFFRLLSFLLVFIFSSSPAQEADIASLVWFQSFFKETLSKSELERRIEAQEAVLKEAVESRDVLKEIKAAKTLAMLHLAQGGYIDSAVDYLTRARALEDSLNLQPARRISQIALSKMFEEGANYAVAKQHMETARTINTTLNAHATGLYIEMQLGRLHALLGDVEEAQSAYELVIAEATEVSDDYTKAEALFNLGEFFITQKNYSDALKSHKEALALWRMLNDKSNEARTLNAIGNLYQLMKNTEKAMANHKVALEIRQALKDKTGLAESYANIGGLYLMQKDYQRSVDNLMLALQNGREAQAQRHLLLTYDYLSQCFENTGNLKRALGYRKEYNLVNEFLLRDQNERYLLEKEADKALTAKKEEIRALDEKEKRQSEQIINDRKLRNLVIALAAASLLVTALVIILYFQKRRSNKVLSAVNEKVSQQNIELTQLNATKDKFFSIISHDLKGPLNSLTSFSSLLINHTDSLTKDEIKLLATDLDKSLKNLFALLENLLEWSRSQTGNMEIKPAEFSIKDLIQQNQQLLQVQAQNKKILISYENATEAIVFAHKNSVNTVVRNLMSNAIKFTPVGGKISVSTRVLGSEIAVSLHDTGIGMSKETMAKLFRIDAKITMKGTADEKGTGLGLILCKEFVEKNGGRIWVDSQENKGSTFSFTLPLAAVAVSKATA